MTVNEFAAVVFVFLSFLAFVGVVAGVALERWLHGPPPERTFSREYGIERGERVLRWRCLSCQEFVGDPTEHQCRGR
jgi:hypothetical protein